MVCLHAVRVHYFNLLEAESMTGYYCAIPFRSVLLNIIIGVDNHTLRNGTEHGFEMATQTFLFENNQRAGKCSRRFIFIDNKPYTATKYSLKH